MCWRRCSPENGVVTGPVVFHLVLYIAISETFRLHADNEAIRSPGAKELGDLAPTPTPGAQRHERVQRFTRRQSGRWTTAPGQDDSLSPEPRRLPWEERSK